MTPGDLERIGIRMYGRKHWRREFSVNLGLDPSTIWRISTRPGDIPAVIEVAVKGLLERHKIVARTAKLLAEQRAREKHRYRGKLTTKKKKKPGQIKPKALIPYAGQETRHGILETLDPDPTDPTSDPPGGDDAG